MVLLKDIQSTKNLYFIVYETINDLFLKIIKENKMRNLFFDIVLISDPKSIKYSLSKIKILSIIPVSKIELFHKHMIESGKQYCVLEKDWKMVDEISYEDMPKYNISKENIDTFMYILEMLKEGKIEPIYIPLKDEEKEKSF